MTEQPENHTPEHLVKVTHPDPSIGAQQVRLDAPEGQSPEDAAKHWLAGAQNDLRWLEGEAEVIPEDAPAPEGVGTLRPPEGEQADQGQGDQGGQAGSV